MIHLLFYAQFESHVGHPWSVRGRL